MKAPWANKTGAAKLAVWSATVLGVSLGLCGANFAAVMGISEPGASGAWASIATGLSIPLMVTAYLELGGMLVGAVGLLGALLWGLWELTMYLANERDSK
jgi:hypothetical protein